MHFWLTVAISFLSFACVAQNGGNNVFSFLEIPLTAKSSAVGGDLINNKGEIEAISDNPSLLDSTLHNDLLFSYVNYIGDINLGYVAYAYQYKDKGTFAASIANVNYGDFVQTNDFGDELGAFKVADYQFNLSFSKSLNDYFSVGTTLKNIYSAMIGRAHV